MTTSLRVGQTVKATTGKEVHQGILRYLGPITDGPPGDYCGIELPEATGKNNGSVKGKEYFRCAPGHGIFVKKNVVTPVAPAKAPAKRASVVPAAASSASTQSTAAPYSKRASINPSSRTTANRQSVSSAPPRKPTTSRPSSQIAPRESPALRSGRTSIQSTPREHSPHKAAASPIKLNVAAAREGEEEQDDDKGDDEEEQEDTQEIQHRTTSPESENGTQPAIEPQAPTKMGPPPRPVMGRESIDKQASVAAQTLREMDQLKVKLRAMEKKRLEDRDKIKQIDTLQSENERLNTIIRTMQAKLKSTTEERKEAQAKMQKLEQRIEADPARPAQLESELELATLDKEMAEERVESLQHELEILKSKYEELEVETDILREENKELGSTMTEEEKADAGWIHLERERDRLREALLLLRDHKQETEAELREEIAHLQSILDETEETAAKYLETAEQLHRIEDNNLHLREQLEAAENQEEVISSIMQERDRHLSQIEDLRASLSELEELAQTNEDLERLYLDNERGLLSRLDEQEALLHDNERRTAEQDRVIEDLEYTLNKFRSVVQGLQSDIDEARRTREISELQAHEMNSRSKAMMELNMRLQNSAAKSQTKAIDIEMVRAQARLQERHIDILSMFLPESFDSERTPITAMLSFSRLKTKAGVVAQTLSDRLRERGHLSSGEETLACYNIVRSMQWIQQVAERFEQFMSSCTPGEFGAFSNASQEIEPVERAVTNWLESLKNDELGADGAEHMKRMQSILADMMEKLITSGPQTTATTLVSEAKLTAVHCENTASLLDWLSRTVRAKLGEPEDDDPESLDFDKKLDQLSTRSRTTKLACAKVVNELERKRVKNICLNETAWPLFTDAEQRAFMIGERVQQVCQVVMTYLNEPEQDEEPSYALLFESMTGAKGELDMLSAVLQQIKSLHDQVEMLSMKAFDQSSQLTFEPQPAPWTLRAKDLKAQRQMSTEVQEELVQIARRNQELASRISEKERTIEEMTIRAELAEKRVKDNKFKEGQEKALQEQADQLQSEKEELQAQLSELQTELFSLQEESRKDKAEITALQSATPEQLPNGTHTPVVASVLDPAASDLMSAHVKALLAQVANLEATIRHLMWENRELSVPISETKFQAACQSWLDPTLLISSKRKANLILRKRQEENEALDALLDVSRSVYMKPVRLKETWRKDNAWRSAKQTTKWHVLRQKEEIEAWNALREGASDGFLLKVR